MERGTTTNSHLIDAPDSTRPTPPAWTAAIVLTVQEAAGVVKLTQWAIYRAIKRGDLVAYKPGGRLRIDEVDLQALAGRDPRVPVSARSASPSTASHSAARARRVVPASER